MTMYAQGTEVSASRSRMEIEQYLSKRRCSSVAVGYEPGAAVVAFAIVDPKDPKKNRHIRFRMPLPLEKDFRSFNTWEQRCREKWRAMALAIKAKFVSIESKVETFDEAWLPHIVIPGGGTVGEHLLLSLAEAYDTGKPLPPLLGSGGPA